MSEETEQDAISGQPVDGAAKSGTVAIRKATLVTALAGVLVAIALGIGGYSIGKNSGEDLEAARAAGAAAGAKAGEKRGEARGFKAGLEQGREAGYAKTFGSSYRDAYLASWEEAGLEAPARRDVKVPKQ